MLEKVLRLASAALTMMAGLALAILPQLDQRAADASAARLVADAAASAPPAPAAPLAASAAVAPAVDLSSGLGAPKILRDGPRLQCAIYARQRSGLELTGDAKTWWAEAEGKYQRGHSPAVGAVIVMGGTSSGHVAVVARILSARQILVDHANWMNQGEIELGALMVDVSPANDWTQVRVWNPPTNSLGLTPYPAMGFVLPARTEMASLETSAH